MRKLLNDLPAGRQEREKIVLFDIDRTLFDTEAFKKSNLKKYSLFEEVLDVLLKLGKIAKLGIFSQGDERLQKKKLKVTRIEKHFLARHVHIVGSKSETLQQILEKYRNNLVFLVDDNLLVLYEIKIAFPSIFVIWVKRGRYAVLQKPIPGFKPDATIKNLKEILKICVEYSVM